MNQPQKKNKPTRSLKGYVIYPRIQLKFAVMNTILFLATLFVSFFISHNMTLRMSQTAEMLGSPELSQQIERIYGQFLYLQMGLFVISTIVIFLLTVFILHRFLGPLVSIIRYFEDLRTTGKGTLHQRSEDCLVPLQEYLETVDISVKKKNESGMTIVEVLVAILIMSVAMLALSSNLGFYNQQVKNIQVKATQTDVMGVLRVAMKDPTSAYNSGDSLPGSDFNKCLQGIGSNSCQHNVEKEFNFFSPLRTVPIMDLATGLQKKDTNGNLLYSPDPVAGVSSLTCNADSFPVFYTANGQRCNCGDPVLRCPLQAVSTFTAYCSAGATCQRPVGLKIAYNLMPRSDLPPDANLNLAQKSGSFYVPLNSDDYFIKFAYGASYVDGNVLYSVGEFDIRQGSVLNFVKPAEIKTNIFFSAKSDIYSVELWRYGYPTGCTTATIGTTTPIDCHAPAKGEFVKQKTKAVTPGKTGFLDFTDSIVDTSMVEYNLIAYDNAGNVVVQSFIPLRVSLMEIGFLSVTPPSTLQFACDITVDSNRFIFQANGSKYGWKSLTAKFKPALNDGTVDFPNFSSKFKDTDPNPQKLYIDPKLFSENTQYEITFSGITGDDYQRTSTKTFMVAAKPVKGIITITSPAAGAKVRTIQDLILNTTINLPCGQEKPKIYTAKTQQVLPSKTLMNTTDFKKEDCTSIAGAVDENKFNCVMTLTCNQWLGVASASQCSSKFGSDTGINAIFSLQDETGGNYSQTSNFTAGSKVSVSIQSGFVQFVGFKTSSLSNPIPSRTPINVVFSSKLLPSETVGLTFADGSGHSQSFTCKGDGTAGTDATYNTTNGICTLSFKTPTSSDKSGVYTLTADDPTTVAVQPANTVSFLWYDDNILSCSHASGAPHCGDYSKTLKTKITALGAQNVTPPYDNKTWTAGSLSSTNYSLSNSTDGQVSLDFFLYYRPSNSNIPTLEIDLTFGVTGSPDKYVAVKRWNGDKCSGSYCAAAASAVDASFYANKKIYGASFNVQAMAPAYANQELLLIRECYCQ